MTATIYRLDTCWEIAISDGRTMTAKSKSLLIGYCQKNSIKITETIDKRTRKESTRLDMHNWNKW